MCALSLYPTLYHIFTSLVSEALMPKPVDNVNNYPKPTFGSYVKEDVTARFPPQEFQPGPPPGQDYSTLTAQHGRPYGRFEQRGGR
jgi:hypothetical protein